MTAVRRLSDSELFRVTNDGLEAISDETLNARIDAAEREAMRRGYDTATAEVVLQSPEAV